MIREYITRRLAMDVHKDSRSLSIWCLANTDEKNNNNIAVFFENENKAKRSCRGQRRHLTHNSIKVAIA